MVAQTPGKRGQQVIGGMGAGSKKNLDSGQILKLEPTTFLCGSNVGREGKGNQEWRQGFDLNNQEGDTEQHQSVSGAGIQM